MADIQELLNRPTDPERVVNDLLHQVMDPEVGVNIVDLGLVRNVMVDDAGNVFIQMTLTTPSCPLGPYMKQSIADALDNASWVESTDVQFVWEPLWDPRIDLSPAARQQLGWDS